MADSGMWSCDRCRWERLHRLEEKLENALQQIELKRKNKGLEEQLREQLLVSRLAVVTRRGDKTKVRSA
jgi:Zn-finger protein